MNSILNFFPQEVIASIGWTLLHSLWQGGIITLLLYFALYYTRNRNANVKAFLSASALVLLITAAAVTFVIKYNAAGMDEASNSSIAVTGISKIFENPVNLQNEAKDTTLFSDLYVKFQTYFKENVQFIVMLWMLGFLFFALRFAGGVYYTSRIRRKIEIINDNYLIESFDALLKKINLEKRVIFAESALVKVPIVLGYFKPMILLPFGLISGLPQDQIEAIVAHEIAHIKRYDILINLFQSIAEIIFFFNPFVWYISHRIRIERENSCDDTAINLCGNSVVYAKALANVESFKESNEPLFAIPLFKNQNQLLRRIKRMLHKDQNQNGFKEKFAAVLIFMGILVMAAVIKNVSPALSSSDAQFNKAGLTLPSSIFVGGKELSGIEIDTTKAIHGKRSFSYFQKEDGKMKRYRARLKDGKLTDLSIDGEKVPQEKLDSYKKDVEEAYSKLDNEDYFFSRNLFPRGEFFDTDEFAKNAAKIGEDIARSFDSEEFHKEMADVQKEIKAHFDSDEFKKEMANVQKEIKSHFDSDEFKKEMADVQKEIQDNVGRWKGYYGSNEGKKAREEAKKEIEKLMNELKKKEYIHNGKFDEKEFEEKMDKLNEDLEYKLKDMDAKNHFSFESLKGLKNLESLKNLEHLKVLEGLKDHEFAMKGLDKSMKELDVNMKGFGEKMKVFGEKMKIFGKFMTEVKDMLVDEKLIDKDDEHTNMNIKKDGIYIDGKKQSDAVFQKVKQIYKKYYNKEFDGDFDLKMNNN